MQHRHEDKKFDAKVAVSEEHNAKSRLPDIFSPIAKTQHNEMKDTVKLPVVNLGSRNNPNLLKVYSLFCSVTIIP